MLLLFVELTDAGSSEPHNSAFLDADDQYRVLKRVRRRSNNQTKQNSTNSLITRRELKATIGDNETNKSRIKLRILSQVDVLSTEYEPPEFVCTKNHSEAAEIYCQGDILHVVMMLGLYKDSKTFVDKPLKKDPNEVIADFRKRFSKAIPEEDREAVEQFVKDNFGTEGEELDEWVPVAHYFIYH